MEKCILQRKIEDKFQGINFASEFSWERLPYSIYSHKSLIRRKLGNVDMILQENKAHNLSLAVKNVSGILIKPNETFSFCYLTGNLTEKRGYKEGLVISNGVPSKGIGGGMCQFTNLIHWMVLHTPLKITEIHHHDAVDLFPDFNRQIPFGTGTSVMYNYIDYRFQNTTDRTYQIIDYVDNKYLWGEILSDKPQEEKYHIFDENVKFVREKENVFRCGTVKRKLIDQRTGNTVLTEILRENHAKVLYDTSNLKVEEGDKFYESDFV